MQKYFPLIVIGLFLALFNYAKAEVYFSQPNSNGYIFFERIPFGHYGNVFKGDDDSLHSFGQYWAPFIADFSGYTNYGNSDSIGRTYPYPIATTTVPSYVSNIILEIRYNNSDNRNYGIQFSCWSPDGTYLSWHSSELINTATLSNTSFTRVDFKFSGPNCDLSKNHIHQIVWYDAGPVGQTDFEVRFQSSNSVPGFGIANGDGIIIDDYEPLISIVAKPIDSARNPVLVIPGVLGTDIFKDNEKLWLDLGRNLSDINDQFMDALQFKSNLDPADINLTIGLVVDKEIVNAGVGNVTLFDYIDGLIQEFENHGYAQGTTSTSTLFTFPYDWRYGVSGSFSDGTTVVDKLKAKINDILLQTGSNKLDIVAHSTGGLLLKKYIMDNPTSNGVDKVVMVGVPSLGSPQAIKTLLVGDSFGIPWLEQDEMKKIAENLPVIYDLAPSSEYFNTNGSFVSLVEQKFLAPDIVKDLNFQEANDFLINENGLNETAIENAKNLHTSNFNSFDMRDGGVDVYSIVGCKSGTLGKLIQKRSKDIYGNPIINYEQPEIISGDATVPFESADYVKADDSKKYYAIKPSHGKMLSADGIREAIVNIISGNDLNLASNVITKAKLLSNQKQCTLKGKQIKIHSPLAIEVVDQFNNRLGFSEDGSLENNIQGADFSVYGEHKYVFLPEDESQIYEIKLNGTGNGFFTLEITDVDDDEVLGTQNFINIPVSSVTLASLVLGVSGPILSLDHNADGIVDQTIEPTSILNSEESKDLVPPTTELQITGDEGQSGFYKSSVNINLSAIDPVINNDPSQTSGVLKTQYNLNNQGYQTYNPATPIVVTNEGSHTLSFFSTDRAGNNEEPRTINFTIDTTSPEITVEFNPNTKNYDFSATDNDSIICTVELCTAQDSAGNTTILKFTKQSLLNSTVNLTLKSISYNNQINLFDPNLLTTSYKISGGVISWLSQTELIKNQQIMNVTYTQKQNQSIITSWLKGGKSVTNQPGLKILKVQTSQGKIVVGVK